MGICTWHCTSFGSEKLSRFLTSIYCPLLKIIFEESNVSNFKIATRYRPFPSALLCEMVFMAPDLEQMARACTAFHWRLKRDPGTYLRDLQVHQLSG